MLMVLLLTLYLTSLLAASNLPTLIERFERGTWGYQTLTVDLGSNINGADTDNSYPKLHVTSPDSVSSTPGGNSHSSNFALNGDFRYTVVRESEDICYSLTARPSFRWSKGKHEREYITSSGDSTVKSYRDHTYRDYYVSAYLTGNYRFYWREQLHWTAGLGARCRIDKDNADYESNEQTEKRRYENYEADINLGLGYGRVRDVTNVVRAKWMADMLLQSHQISLSDEQILRLAQMLDSQSAYSATLNLWNNASTSTFWQDVMNELNLQLTYDQFLSMTREARNHTLLTRRQGRIYEVGFLGDFLHYWNNNLTMYSRYTYYEKEQDESTDYNSYGVYAKVISWTNLSTHMQFSFSAPVELLFRTSEETNKWINTSDDEVEKNSASIDFTLLTVSPEVAYLIQLTNRMGCTLQAGVSYYDFSGDVDYSYLQGEISADLAYYLSPSTQLVFYTDYHRFDFFSDEAIDDGGKQSDNWRVELSIHWRPVSLLF